MRCSPGRRLPNLPPPMTPHEKAVDAINVRLERLQANLREAQGEVARRFLFQSVVVTIAIAEALGDYVKAVGANAERRFGTVKQKNEILGSRHNELLQSGQQLLEKLKVDPTNQSVRSEIEQVKREMAAVQKDIRRDANALQRELAPTLAMIDEMSMAIRRFTEADEEGALKRQISAVIGHVRNLYAAQSVPLAPDVVTSWEAAAVSELDQGTEYHDAYARAGHQVTLALEWLIMAVSENPPSGADEAVQRANEAVGRRLKEITARITSA